MPRQPDFYRSLNEQLLEQLEEYARQPGRTGEEVHGWLSDRKVTTSRSAVYRWLQDFRLEDNARKGAESRAKYLQMTDKLDPGSVAKATHRLLAERIYDLAVDADDPDTINTLTRSFQRTTDVMEQLEDRDRRIATAGKELDKAEQAGDVKPNVVTVLKQALGIIAA